MDDTSIDFAENTQPVLVKTSGSQVLHIHMPGDPDYAEEVEQIQLASDQQGVSFSAAAADFGYEIGSFSLF